MKQTRSKHKANVSNIHVQDVCFKFASCLLHRVNTSLADSHNSNIYINQVICH